MPKQPFTPAGVAAKQSELYALTKAKLSDECNQMIYNLHSWVGRHFSLTGAQQEYLDNMEPDFVESFSEQLSYAVFHKRPVNFFRTGDERGTKVFEVKSTIGQNGSGDVIGELTIEVTFE